MKKHLILIIVLLVCFGCNPKEKPYVYVSENGKFASTNLEPEEIDIKFNPPDVTESKGLIMTSEANIAKDHNLPIATVPTVYIYPTKDEPGEYWSFPFSMENNKNYNDPLFNIGKEIFCSDNPFAKELVAKYKITSDTIECLTRR